MVEPTIPVDFNNCDEDGSVRLNTNGVHEFTQDTNFQFSEGLSVRMTDGEFTASGKLIRRDGIWVASELVWE